MDHAVLDLLAHPFADEEHAGGQDDQAGEHKPPGQAQAIQARA